MAPKTKKMSIFICVSVYGKCVRKRAQGDKMKGKKIVVFLGVFWLGACVTPYDNAMPLTPSVEIVPGGAIFSALQKVQIVANGAHDRIVYTLDNSDPSCETSLVYANEITVTDSLALKARACKIGWQPSETARALFLKSP